MTIPADIRDRFMAVLDEAYQAGFAAGGNATRDAILRAVTAPTPPTPPTQAIAPPRAVGTPENERPRAPRGLVRTGLFEVLRKHPGATIQEAETAISNMNPQVSSRSVGGEMRRMAGVLYRQEGKRWFLLDTMTSAQRFGGTTGADTPAAEKHSDAEKANASP